jgi:hypothetical protein
MKKLLIAVMIATLISVSPIMGEDSNEVLTLKRDLAQERVLRIQTQLALIQK